MKSQSPIRLGPVSSSAHSLGAPWDARTPEELGTDYRHILTPHPAERVARPPSPVRQGYDYPT